MKSSTSATSPEKAAQPSDSVSATFSSSSVTSAAIKTVELAAENTNFSAETASTSDSTPSISTAFTSSATDAAIQIAALADDRTSSSERFQTSAISIPSTDSTSISAVTCTPESPQCCWVVRIWKLMGKSNLFDHTSSTACCSMSGVTCSGSTVTKIEWGHYGLNGSIPDSIGNLLNLIEL
jgi:hypothetical protein